MTQSKNLPVFHSLFQSKNDHSKKNPEEWKKEERRKSRLVTITRRYRNSQTFNLLFFSRCRVCVCWREYGWWCRFWKSSHRICSTRYSQALLAFSLAPFVVTVAQGKNCSNKKVLKRMSGFGKRGRGHKKRFSSLFCSFLLFPFPSPVSGRCCCHGGKREEGEKWSKKGAWPSFSILEGNFGGKGEFVGRYWKFDVVAFTVRGRKEGWLSN